MLDLSSLNERQREAVEAPFSEPLLIAAGAGTGKTRTLTSRLLYIIENGGGAASICALTFTNKAAREMRSRVFSEKENSAPKEEPFIGTFHSFGASILRREHARFARTRDFIIYDDHDSFSLIKKIVKAAGCDPKGPLSPSRVAGKISKVKNLVRNESREAALAKEKGLSDIFVAYEESLTMSNAFDFDDLISKVVFLFATNADIAGAYRSCYAHVLVDEYQDVNDMQNELIRHIASHGRLTVVGDDQQTIYSWRGSNMDIFLGFGNDWPGSRVVVLDQNYRSSGMIISAASALIERNTHQQPKRLWTENPNGEKIRILETGSEEEEAERVAQAIGEKLQKEGSVAVLFRTNAQSRAIEQALIHHGIPYEIYGGLKFYERKEIKDIIAFLRSVANPKDTESRERLRKNLAKSRLSGLRDALEGKDAASSRTPSEWVNFFLERTGYLDLIEASMTNPAERKENVSELLYFASTFSELVLLLEQVSLLQSTDSLRRKKDSRVTLATIHMAKGLEFDFVFVIGCREDLLPHSLSMESPLQIEEERRLLYVAMTRARVELCLSYSDIPSRFLFEVPPEHTEFESGSSDALSLSGYSEERYITLD